MLDKKKAVLIRLKIKTIWLGKKLFQEVIKITVFFIINSCNEGPIRHIHRFEYIFCHQKKAMKFALFHMFLFYGLYFEFYSLNVFYIYYKKCVFIFIMNYCCNKICIHAFCFLRLLLSTKNEYILASTQQILQSQYQRFHLSFFQSIISIITKIKHFFLAVKIFVDIFSFNLIH